MNKKQLLNQVNQIFKEVLEIEELSLKGKENIIDIDGWDSLNHVKIILGIESEFNIRLKASEVFEIEIIDELIEAIRSKI
tara:strand:- start:26253 stop:26492 length:240 start_codon:yes stop_codon:yes gene_type:complete